MEQVIQSYVSGQHFMGSVLVARGNEIILDKGYGFANLEWEIPDSPIDEIPAGVDHQTVHGGFDPAPGGTRKAERDRPGEEIHARRPSRMGQDHDFQSADAHLGNSQLYEFP